MLANTKTNHILYKHNFGIPSGNPIISLMFLIVLPDHPWHMQMRSRKKNYETIIEEIIRSLCHHLGSWCVNWYVHDHCGFPYPYGSNDNYIQ